MMLNCRFPGCTVQMQTLPGLQMHEAMCHGLSQNWMAEEVFAQVQAQSGTEEVDVPLEHQLAYAQDLIIIEEAMDSSENSCCC